MTYVCFSGYAAECMYILSCVWRDGSFHLPVCGMCGGVVQLTRCATRFSKHAGARSRIMSVTCSRFSLCVGMFCFQIVGTSTRLNTLTLRVPSRKPAVCAAVRLRWHMRWRCILAHISQTAHSRFQNSRPGPSSPVGWPVPL